MLNRIQLIGNLADDAIIRTTQSGVRYATFRLITSDETYNKIAGSWEAKTTGFNVVVWGNLVKYAEKAAMKGRLFVVEAKMKEHRYESDGQARYSWQAVVNDRFGLIRSLTRATESGSQGRYDPSTSDHSTTIEGELVEQY